MDAIGKLYGSPLQARISHTHLYNTYWGCGLRNLLQGGIAVQMGRESAAQLQTLPAGDEKFVKHSSLEDSHRPL